MGNFRSLSSATKSVEMLLNAAFAEEQPVGDATAKASVVASSDFSAPDSSSRIPKTGISIFPFRVEPNSTMRAGWSAVGNREGRGYLALDLHLLLTPWGGTPEAELAVVGRAMQRIEEVPILSGPLLEGSGGWEDGEAVQLVLGEIGIDEIARAFETFPFDYRLSVPYIVRVIRITTAERPQSDVKTAMSRAVPSMAL